MRSLIHPFVPSFGPRHLAIPQNQHNSFLAEPKQIADRGLFCRIHLKKPSFRRTDSSPSWTHKSDSLPYQILVLTLLWLFYSEAVLERKTLWLTVRNRSVVRKIASMTYYYGLIRTGGLFVKAL
jgi:hypothetical protein